MAEEVAQSDLMAASSSERIRYPTRARAGPVTLPVALGAATISLAILAEFSTVIEVIPKASGSNRKGHALQRQIGPAFF